MHLVRAHHLAETEVLTAEVVAQGGPPATTAREDLRRVDEQLQRATTALAGTELTSPELAAVGQELQQALTAHGDILLHQVLEPVGRAVARKEVRRLGGAYAERRDRGLRDEGEADPPPRRLDLSRAELYELAKRAGIEGRSGMSRGDLITELQRRQQTR